MAAPATCAVHLATAAAPSLVLDETEVVGEEVVCCADPVEVVTGQSSEHGRAEVNGWSAELSGKTGAWVAMVGFGVTLSASGLSTPEMMCIIPFAMRISGCTICAELTNLLLPACLTVNISSFAPAASFVVVSRMLPLVSMAKERT